MLRCRLFGHDFKEACDTHDLFNDSGDMVSTETFCMYIFCRKCGEITVTPMLEMDNVMDDDDTTVVAPQLDNLKKETYET